MNDILLKVNLILHFDYLPNYYLNYDFDLIEIFKNIQIIVNYIFKIYVTLIIFFKNLFEFLLK